MLVSALAIPARERTFFPMTTTQSPEALARFVGDQFLRTRCYENAIKAYKEVGATDQILAIAHLSPDLIEYDMVSYAFKELGQAVPQDVGKVHLAWHRSQEHWGHMIKISEAHGFRIPRRVFVALGDVCLASPNPYSARRYYERAKAWDRLDRWVDVMLAHAVSQRTRFFIDDDNVLPLCRTRRFKHKLSACADTLLLLNDFTGAAALYVENGQTLPTAKFVEAGDRLLRQGNYPLALEVYQTGGAVLSVEHVETLAEEAFQAEDIVVAIELYVGIGKKIPVEKKEAYADLAYKLEYYGHAVMFCTNPLLPEKFAVYAQHFFEKAELDTFLGATGKTEVHEIIDTLRERGASVPSAGIATYAERCFQAKMYAQAATMFRLADVRAHGEFFLAWADTRAKQREWRTNDGELKDVVLDAYEVAGAADRLLRWRADDRVARLCAALGIPALTREAAPRPVPAPAPGEDPVLWADARLAKRNPGRWDPSSLGPIVEAYRSAGAYDKLMDLGDRCAKHWYQSSRHMPFVTTIYETAASVRLPSP